MNKNIKKAVVGLVAFNVVASTMITMVPTQSKAAENNSVTEVGNKVETRLAGTLKESGNLLKNTQFTDVSSWTSWEEYTQRTLLGPDEKGWFYNYPNKGGKYYVWPVGNGSVLLGVRGANNTSLSQVISTIPGHKYRISYTAKENSGNTGYRVTAFKGNSTSWDNRLAMSSEGVENIVGPWGPFRKSDGLPKTLEFTATASTSTVDFSFAEKTSSEGTLFYSGLSVVDLTTIADTSMNSITTQSTTATGKGQPGGTVIIKNNGIQIGTGIVNINGDYNVAIPKQTYNSTVTATVTALEIQSSATQTVKQAPLTNTTINPLTTQDITASGKAEPGSVVTLKAGGKDYIATVSLNGIWSVAIPKQAKETIVEATAVLNGVSSNKAIATVSYVGPSTPMLNNVTNKSTSITGTGDPGNIITVKVKTGSESISYTGNIDDFGEFTVKIDAPEAGAIVEAIAKDNANVLSDKTSITVIDVIAPDAPKIQPVKSNDTKVTGTGEANTAVKIILPSGGEVTGKTTAEGSFSIAIPAQTEGSKIKVTLTDAAGNESVATTVTVQANSIEAPAINTITTDDIAVTGTGIAGALVKVKANNIEYSGTVKVDGTYSIAIPKQTLGTTITATQTKDGIISATSSKSVTQGTLAAPTINDYYATAGYVTGTAPAGASKIALYIDNTLVRYGAVDSNGKYQIYAADNAKMNTAGTAFQVVAIDANGNMGTKANATVKAKIVAPSINDYYTTDVYAKGTATGASKVTLYINGKAARTAAVNANGSYSIYTGDQASLTTAGATFQISATNTAGLESTKTTGTVKSKLAAPVINKYVATDAYARGTASAGSKQVVLYVDGKAVRTANVNANGTYAIYTGDQVKLTTAGNTFQISSKDAAGNESPKATGTVLSVLAAPVIAPYYTSDVYATGTTTGAATKVALYVDGKFVRYATVTDGKYSIYTGDQAMLRTAGNTFQIAAVDANGIIGSMTKGTVLVDNRVDSKLTANDYNLAVDQSVTGEAGKDITRVKIYVNGELKRQTNVADGAYSIYAKDVITKASDEVVIVGYDTQGYERNRVSVPVNNEAPKTYNLTANEYNLAKDKNVTGTSDTGITRVQLVVNDVVVRATATANGSYEIYAEDKIKLGDKVEIVGLDSSNIARKTVAVSVVNNTPVAKNITVDDYTIGTDNITGTFDPEIKKVQLFVDGSFIRQAAISGTSFTTYAADKVTSKSQTVEMVGFDTSGAEIARQAVNVK
ncbi:hypothetical protein HCB20_11705 [Listeria welshimeri]|nr:hypothetical protein [Listeria welshimeri]